MSRLLAWLLGGGTALAAIAVAAWIVMDQQRDDPGRPPEPDVAATDDATATLPRQPAGEAQMVENGASGSLAPEVAGDPSADAGSVAEPARDDGPSTRPDPETVSSDPGSAPVYPSFDVVRVARDGAALVAGSALPGAAVTLRVDGAVVAESAADAAGQFVLMFDLGFSDVAQVMTLEMAGADGVTVLSEDTVVLTPRPVIVASADGQGLDAPTMSAAREAEVSDGVGSVGTRAAADIVTRDIAGAAPGDVSTVAELGDDTAPRPAAPVPTVVADAPVSPEPEGVRTPVAASESETVETASPAPAGPVALDEVPSDPVIPSEDRVGESASAASEVAAADPSTGPETPDEPAPSVAGTQLAQAADLPTAFIVRGGGAIEVIGAAPQVMDNVVIDSISYSATGDVQIAGRAARTGPEADLRIYLDNRPIAVARADRGGWASDLPNIDPGVYTLRIDQLNDQGSVVSRFETPFQREDPDIVARAQARMAVQSAEGAARVEGHEESAALETTPLAAESALPLASGDAVDNEAVAVGATDAAPTAGAQAAASGSERVAAETTADAPAAGHQPGQAGLPASPEPAPQRGASVLDPSANQTAVAAGPGGGSAPMVPPVSLITVQPGHTLWAISRDRYGAGELYVLIYRANRSQIRNPDLIYPGQIFELPEE